MNNLKQLIIIGGGSSIKEGLAQGLWERLKDKFTIGLNYSYKYFESTFQSWVDNDFYKNNLKELAKLSLLIGCESGEITKIKLPNTITLTATSKYDPTLKTGVYKKALVGLFGLSIACYLLTDIKDAEIYLLGYDFSAQRRISYEPIRNRRDLNKILVLDKHKRFITHFYQGEINHRGIGKISFYNNTEHQKKIFQPYIDTQSVSIYNVSIDSKINQFPKITYTEFFKRLDKQIYNQKELREWIKKQIGGIQ